MAEGAGAQGPCPVVRSRAPAAHTPALTLSLSHLLSLLAIASNTGSLGCIFAAGPSIMPYTWKSLRFLEINTADTDAHMCWLVITFRCSVGGGVYWKPTSLQKSCQHTGRQGCSLWDRCAEDGMWRWVGSRTASVSSPPDATYYQLLCICPEGRTPLLATNWGRAGRMDSGVRALVPVQAPYPPSSGPTSVQPPVHLSERRWQERRREATLVTGITRQHGLHPPGSHWRVVTYHLFDGSHSWKSFRNWHGSSTSAECWILLPLSKVLKSERKKKKNIYLPPAVLCTCLKQGCHEKQNKTIMKNSWLFFMSGVWLLPGESASFLWRTFHSTPTWEMGRAGWRADTPGLSPSQSLPGQARPLLSGSASAALKAEGSCFTFWFNMDRTPGLESDTAVMGTF